MTTINNYPILSQNYLQNSQIICTPAFRGVGSNSLSAQGLQPAQNTQTTSPTISPTLSYPPDTVEISAENKIKTQKTKKQGMSTAAKVGLGIVGTVATCIAAKKIIPPMRMQSRLKECFFKEFSKDEAKALQKKYQDILKITDKDEFLDKVFAELKKDYGLEDVPIKLDKAYKSGGKCGAITAGAHNSFGCGRMEIGVDMAFNNETLFRNLTHELRHALQYKKIYQCSTAEEYLASLKSAYKDKLSDVEIKETCDEHRAFLDILKLKRINKGDADYEYARKVLDSFKQCANDSKELYRSTFYETDARHIENTLDAVIHNELFPSTKMYKRS